MDFGMSESDFRKLVVDEAAPLPTSYSLSLDETVLFLAVKESRAATSGTVVVAAKVFSWSNGTGSKKSVHNFVVAHEPYSGQWAFWCGDQWLEGRAPDQSARRDQALTYLSSKGIRPSDGKVRLHDGVGFPLSTACNFFRNGNSCKHRNASFNYIKTLGLSRFIDDMRAGSAPLVGGVAAPVSPSPVVPGVDPMLAKLSRYAFAKHLVLEGDKGWGKTWLATKFAADATGDVQKMVYIGGHEGLESVDLVGHMIKAPDGSLAWKDGKLSEAFRCASAGIKTMVLFDELLRVRKRELSVLVSALAPHADGKLHLSTGRAVNVIDGIAEEEVLTCERSDLWVVATTNVGASYEVDDMEEALSDRFPIVLRVEGGTEMLKTKLGPLVTDRGFSPALLDRFVRLYEGYQTGRVNAYVTRQINLRHLCEIVEMADSEAEIPELVGDRIPQWVERDVDGGMVKAQLEFVRDLIKTAFTKVKK